MAECQCFSHTPTGKNDFRYKTKERWAAWSVKCAVVNFGCESRCALTGPVSTGRLDRLTVHFVERPICSSLIVPRSGELRTQKLKSHLVRTQSLNVLPLKPGVGQYIAMHATLTARDFFLVYFYTSGPFTCIFSKTSPDFSLCWLWLTHGSCVDPQNKIGHPAGCRFPC